MKKSLLQLSVCILMGVILLLAGPATAEKAADVEADVAAIKEIWKNYRAAAETGNSDLWLSLWDENGIQMPPGMPARGKQVLKEAVPKGWSARKPGTKITMNINAEEITVAGDWAYSRGTYTKTTTPPGGQTVHVDGKFLTILKRQPDGSWKIFRDCFNSNVPPG